MKNIYDKFPKTIEITKKPSFFGFFEIWGNILTETDIFCQNPGNGVPGFPPPPPRNCTQVYKCPLVTASPPIYLVTLYATKNSASLPKIKKSK